ncbi:MAG TPA: amidohydrolase [Thermomicrobiales bacterium]|nr:amidohydrolase [Thermomicrobiales bacterium]
MARLLIHGGPILTMDPANPLVEAVGIEEGRIAAVGSLSDVTSYLGSRFDEIDLRGRLATPGLYDAHCHVMMTGFALNEIDVSAVAAPSIVVIQEKVRAVAQSTPPGAWIVGQGYDQASLAEQRHPTRYDLDAVAPDHPVILWRSCHHILVANSAALRAGGVSAATADLDDGVIDRDEHGEPTGVLREAATHLVTGVRDEPTEDDLVQAILAGGNEFRRHGVTSAAEAGIRAPEQLRAYQRLANAGNLPLRTYLMMLIDETLDEMISLGIRSGFGNDMLRIGNAKLFSDGSIGGRTARMRKPYEGEPDNYGIWMIPPSEVKAKVLKAHTAGFQIGIHAIGDAAIELILDAYAEAQAALPRPDVRHRIEHCSIVDEGLIARIAEQKVIPIPGTTFLHYTRAAYEQNLGRDRFRYAYAMKTFAENGIIAAASSDAPVVPVNPMLGIATMVTRLDRLGGDAWTEERVPVEEAIKAYTWNAAYASHEESIKGSLRPGLLGDVTIFETDLRSVAPTELHEIKVDHTILNGDVVYAR